MTTDLYIHSDAGIQDGNANASNVDEIVAQMLADSRIDSSDKVAIDNLHSALTTQEAGLFSQSKEALKGILLSVLQKGYDVKGVPEREQLQKILKIVELNYDLEAIFAVNKEYLSTTEVLISDKHTKKMRVVTPAVASEDKTFTFKVEEGVLKIYEHKAGLNRWGNDFIGHVNSGNPVIERYWSIDAGKDDGNLSDNGTTYANADNLLKALHEDTIRNDIALLKAQNEAQTREIQLLKDADVDTLRKIEELNKKIDQIQKDIQKLNEKIASMDDVASEMQDDILVLTDEHATLLARQTELSAEIDALEGKIASSETKNLELEKVITQLKTRLENIGTEIAAIKTKYEPIIDVETKERKIELDALTIELEKDILGKNGTKESFQRRLDAINAQAYALYPKAGRNMIQDMIDTYQDVSDIKKPEILENPKVKQVILKDKGDSKTLDVLSGFKLNNPIKLLDWNKELLPKIESKGQLIELLKKFQDVRFPDSLADSTLYAYTVQCAISLIDPQNTLGNIDGLWEVQSKGALKKVQSEKLGFIGKAIDGNPGIDSVKALIQKLES